MEHSTKAEKYFWLLVYFLSPIIPITFIYNSNIHKFSIPIYFLAMAAATTGFVWLVYQFVLTARPKFIERCFGLDKFYVFHGIMPIIAVALIFLHKMLVDEDSYKGLLTNLGDLAFEIFLGVVVLGLLFITNSILLKIKPIAIIKNFFQKHPLFKYKNQVLIHNLSVVAYIIMFIHVLLTPAIKRDFASRLVFTLYFILGLCFYIYHSLIKKISLKKDMYIVKDVLQESEKMWTLKLVPRSKNIFPYKPGQFSYIKIFGKNIKAEVHPFSISSSPTNNDYISFTIKELGDYTNEIGKVQVNDKVQVDGPYGRFSYVLYPNETATVLIAGGVGITPNLSMLRYISSVDKDRNVVLLWGIGTKKDLICFNEFGNMQKQMKNFHFIPVMFRDSSWNGEKGIIDKEKIERILKQYEIDTHCCGYYICGPAILTSGVIATLKNMAVKKELIHFEKFSM